MSNPEHQPTQVVPAQLNFLAIYNPSLSTSEETQKDQIVFYYSRHSSSRLKRQDGQADPASNEEENEQLRQVGLAQGMVNFAKTFSNGQPVDSVESEKHRTVIHELETDWWILASIDLTCIPVLKQSTSKSASASPSVEYSTREVSPPALLCQQLLQAHQIFLLHHGSSLSHIFVRLARDRFCGVLDRFWTKFALNWDVMLHGNPSTEIYGGVKLAAGGELGVGVGEEEWGSGEREVLEGLGRNTDGLVDLFVSRYGASSSPNSAEDSAKLGKPQPRRFAGIGQMEEPGPDDGLILSGLGSINRSSLRSLTNWVKWVFLYGEDAYGVRDNPSSTRRKRRRNQQSQTATKASAYPNEESSQDGKQKTETESKSAGQARPHIPRPIVSTAEESLKAATTSSDAKAAEKDADRSTADGDADSADNNASQQWVKYLTLGYGSVWGPSKTSQTSVDDQKPVSKQEPNTTGSNYANNTWSYFAPTVRPVQQPSKSPTQKTSVSKASGGGSFLIGLRGNLDAEDEFINEDDDRQDPQDKTENDWSSRLVLRTLYVDLDQPVSNDADDSKSLDAVDPPENTNNKEKKRFQVVMYIHAPFIYTLLFEPSTASLSLPSFFHDLHHHLTPLHGSLLRSTSPDRVSTRLKSMLSAGLTSTVYDIVYSPQSCTIRCSLPNIPPVALQTSSTPKHGTSPDIDAGLPPRLSRAEALTIHTQLLQTYIDTRKDTQERERTMKSTKGWWIVWMRLPTSHTSPTRQTHPASDPDATHSEAILVRKAHDQPQPKSSWLSVAYPASSGSASLRARRDAGTGTGTPSALSRLVGRDSADPAASSGARSPGKLADGMALGMDPKKYVEVLLSLNR